MQHETFLKAWKVSGIVVWSAFLIGLILFPYTEAVKFLADPCCPRPPITVTTATSYVLLVLWFGVELLFRHHVKGYFDGRLDQREHFSRQRYIASLTAGMLVNVGIGGIVAWATRVRFEPAATLVLFSLGGIAYEIWGKYLWLRCHGLDKSWGFPMSPLKRPDRSTRLAIAI